MKNWNAIDEAAYREANSIKNIRKYSEMEKTPLNRGMTERQRKYTLHNIVRLMKIRRIG